MNPSNSIEIHEFNTGIHPERTENGGWISRGFTGRYINVTLQDGNIPDVVERSIANWEFAVTEGASTEKPAIIGRVVGTENNVWSVMAVVTRGRDEIGRSLSVYRYFLCEGANNLWKILAWWESQGMPTFDPFDTKSIGQPNLYIPSRSSSSEPPPEILALISNASEPTLLSHEQQYDLSTINILAMRKAKSNGQPISWAYNAQALEKPERFQVIHTASDRAYQILQRVLANTPKVLLPVVADEAALKSAIRGLMNNSQVKPENIKVIADALFNDKITSEYWHTLFDGQGATAAISQKIYSPQMVRLVTLRAVVIPETMLEFLGWLNIKPGQKQKSDEHQTVSLEFQKAIRSALPKDKLANSIKFILPELLNESPKITPEAISWLLRSNDSVWASGFKDFIKDVSDDLQLIVDSLKGKNANSSNSYKCDPQTWARLDFYKREIYLSRASYKVEEYVAFAKLFESLREYPLSAYFYQISQGIVPKKIFEEIPEGRNSYELLFLGLNLTREVTLPESVIRFLLQEYIVPIQFVIILSISLSIFSFVGGLIVGKSYPSIHGDSTSTQSEKDPNNSRSGSQNTGNGNNSNSKTTGSNTSSTGTSNSGNWRLKASQQFNTTRKAVAQIITNINQEERKQYGNNLSNPKKIIKTIQFVLKVENIDYDKAPSNEKDKMDFLDAIYEYQKNNISEPKNWDGIITSKGATAKKLEADVRNELGLPSMQPNSP